MTHWEINVRRYWVETKKRNKKGEIVLAPNDVRKMLIHGEFVTTNCFRATVVKRHGERYISVKALISPKRAWWDKTPITADEKQWKDYDKFSIEKFEQWLTKMKIPSAGSIVCELLTAPPENLAA